MTDKVIPIREGCNEANLKDGVTEQILNELVHICNNKGMPFIAIAVENGEATIFASQHAYTEALTMVGALEFAKDHMSSAEYIALLDEEQND